LTDLQPYDDDSDDEIEKNILPRRPGPSGSRPPAAAADARPDNREIPRQTTASSPSVGALSNSAQKTDNKETRFALFIRDVDCVDWVFYCILIIMFEYFSLR